MPAKRKALTATNTAGYAAPAAIAADPVIFTVGPVEGAPAPGPDRRFRPEDVVQSLWIVRDEEPFKGKPQLAGGFVGETESAEQTALRKLEEKTGVRAGYLEQLRTYDDPGRDPRGWIPSVAFLALVPFDSLAGRAAEDHHARWIPMTDLAEMADDIAFDHARIVADAFERLRGKLWYSNIAMGLLPDEFTLGEAKHVYEAILGHDLERGNFHRNMLLSGLIEETGNRKATKTRTGKAYRFISREPEWSPSRTKVGR